MNMAIVIENLQFSFGEAVILKDINLSVNPGDKIGIVGDNGGGKTTLLNLLCGRYLPESGAIYVPSNVQIGYIEQGMSLNPQNTVIKEMKTVLESDTILARMKQLEKSMGSNASMIAEYDELCARYQAIDGYNLDYKIRMILSGMGFPEQFYDRPVSVLSGGEKTKLAMAKLLVADPDLMILDEPTNHLDMAAAEWLKGFLAEFKKAVLVVSHDGSFLDAVCNRIFEVENHTGRLFNGNYSAYRLQKQQTSEVEAKRWRETQEKAKKLEEYVAKNLARASTSNMAKSRRKALEKMDLTAPENHAHEKIFFRFPEMPAPYKELLKTKGLSVGIKGNKLFSLDDLLLLRGENLAIIGANGTGKTTLLRTILRKLPPVAGSVTIGAGSRVSYYEQNVFTVEPRDAMTVVRDIYPKMTTTEIRTLLASVGLRGEEVFIRVDKLSGGERARLMMCLISLEKPNVIILDEPTNHLDIYSKEVLTDALKAFCGTVIAVSHDIEFINELNCRIISVEKGEAKLYKNIEAWQKNAADDDTVNAKPKAKAMSAKDERREKALRRQAISEIESKIAAAEQEVAKCERILNDPQNATDAELLHEQCEALAVNKQELDRLTEEWLLLEEQDS